MARSTSARRCVSAAKRGVPRRRVARIALVVAVAALLGGAGALNAPGTGARPRATIVLLGHRGVPRSVERESAGHGAAFPYRARSSGKATSISVYVESRGRAARLTVAIYADRRGHPSALLTRGSRTHPPAHSWTRVAVRATRVVAGRRYWLAVAASRGYLAFRYRVTGSCRRQERRWVELRSLPKRWAAAGAASSACQISAYVSGRARVAAPLPGRPTRPAPTPPGTTPTTATTPRTATTSTTPTAPTSSLKGCFPAPTTCGYPDKSDTGVPSGTPLTTHSGNLVVSQPGTVISNYNVVNGSIEISASNVTIKNTQVTNSGDTSNDILIDSGVSGVLIEDSTLRGSASNSALQYAVQNAGSSSNKGLRLNLYYCTECWSGPGTLEGSYANADGVISGSHYEDIYYGGGGGPLVVTHDTLLNPQGQTAVVFLKTDFGEIDAVTISNSLLAGGGYTLYGGLGGSGNVAGPVTVTGNRFARCLTASNYDGFGYTCSGGHDAHGYWPRGGYYGASADFRNAVTRWSGNYWDDNLQAVALSG
jgi:hypothetical protein